MCAGVCVCLHLWVSVRSWRCCDGVQVFHQALKVRHLLGQLVRLVALRERNRVTARGWGGAGGEGGKHLEVGKEEREGEERTGGRGGQSGIHQRQQEGAGWVG